MKMNFKPTTSALAVLWDRYSRILKRLGFTLTTAMITIALFSSPALAQNSLNETSQPGRPVAPKFNRSTSTAPSVNFCARFEKAFDKLQTRAAAKRDKLAEKKNQRLQNFKAQWEKRDQKLAEYRKRIDERRNDRYAGLEARAQTDAQKAAIEKFKADVEAAVAARKAAIDAAIKAFREGVDAATKQRLEAIKGAGDTYKAAVDAAVAKAKADCAAGVEPAAIKQQFHDSMKAAQDAFAKARADIEKLQPQLEALKATRNNAVKKAIDNFKAALQKAKTELKAAFGQSNTTNTTTTP